jgi:hypothetical protein
MAWLTSVVVVGEARTAVACAIVVLCAEHAAMLKAARWARIEEVVGFSSLMPCEACLLIADPADGEPASGTSSPTQARNLRLIDREAPRSQTRCGV